MIYHSMQIILAHLTWNPQGPFIKSMNSRLLAPIRSILTLDVCLPGEDSSESLDDGWRARIFLYCTIMRVLYSSPCEHLKKTGHRVISSAVTHPMEKMSLALSANSPKVVSVL